MVDLQTMISSNNRLSTAKGPYVALFVGATSGIGLGVLKEFTRHAVDPRVYFVARNATTAASIVDELRVLNPRGKFEIIEKNVSLLKDAEKVAELVKAKESSLDLLFLSAGFFSLDGRKGDLPVKNPRSYCHVLISYFRYHRGARCQYDDALLLPNTNYPASTASA
jgi:NAD(P)-dependent dehydrogenase (short-subunit alcohol dehydrogenase family)